MHNMLFQNQDALEDENLISYAAQLGIQPDWSVHVLETHSFAPRVREDFMSGVRSGVNGTPTFYIDGVRHDDSYDPDTLLAALERAAA